MIVGIICVGMLVGFLAACIALFTGYSVLMALWFYALFGSLAAVTIGSVAFAVCLVLQAMREREAQQRQTQ